MLDVCDNGDELGGDFMESTVDNTIRHVLNSMRHIRKGDISSAILVILIELGFCPQSDGFGHLRKAIYQKFHDPDQRFVELYESVGKMYTPEVGSFQVEQAIRSAISAAWESGSRENWACFFPKDRDGNWKKPSNGEFISRLACMLELWSSCREE